MAFAAVAALAALSALALGALAVRSTRARADRRFEAVLGQLDRHLGAISASLERVVQRATDARTRSVDELELSIDLDELLRRIAAEAAVRTQADAAAVHVIGPAGAPRSATFGAGDRVELFDAPLGENAGAFRAVTINWTHRPGTGREGNGLSSALVVPILEGGAQTGSLAAYAPGQGAFGPEHVRALERLAEDAAPAIASARRYAEAQAALTDPDTGLRNEVGYRAELDRAVARAGEAAGPLSLLVLAYVPGPGGNRADEPMHDLARMLARLTRAADVVCRRDAGSLAVILPETTGESGRSFHRRVVDAASQAWLRQPATFEAGLAEWRPGEQPDELDARTNAGAGSRLEAIELRTGNRPAESVPAPSDTRDALRDRLAGEIARARQLGQPLALLLANVVDELRRVEAEQGAAAAAQARASLDAQARDAGGATAAWIEDDTLTLVLYGATAAEAESVLVRLRGPGGGSRDPDASSFDWRAVSAGITELAAADDAAGLLARARHALTRARRAGRGTIVVAMAADDFRP